jgi:hypothetical protein
LEQIFKFLNLEQIFKLASDIAPFATAVGVFIACWQIHRSAQQSRTDFEDELAKEYRQLARDIPVDALLGGELSQHEQEKALKVFYQYVDLSNEQTFLRKNGRVSKQTWLFWRDGIKSNLERPSFNKAWQQIKLKAPKSFEELCDLESTNFTEDPYRGSFRKIRSHQESRMDPVLMRLGAAGYRPWRAAL